MRTSTCRQAITPTRPGLCTTPIANVTHPEAHLPEAPLWGERQKSIGRSAKSEVKKTTVDTNVMPLGNHTEMTAAERSVLRDWIAAGARIR